MKIAGASDPDLVLTEMKMPIMSGIELLDYIHQLYPALPVIVMTAFGTVEKAVFLETVDIYGSSLVIRKKFGALNLLWHGYSKSSLSLPWISKNHGYPTSSSIFSNSSSSPYSPRSACARFQSAIFPSISLYRLPSMGRCSESFYCAIDRVCVCPFLWESCHFWNISGRYSKCIKS